MNRRYCVGVSARRVLTLSLPVLMGVAIAALGSLLLEAVAGSGLRPALADGGSSGIITRTTAADFQVCSALTGAVPTPVFTSTITSDALGGEIRLAATLEDYFNGSAVDLTRWITGTAYEWYTVPPSVANGVLTLDSAYLRSQANFQPVQPRFFEAYAQKSINGDPAGWPDLGFYRELYPLDPNAITSTSSIRLFVTRNDNSSFVRARDGDASAPLIDQDIPAIDLTQYHLFRIEWDLTETRYYVDGVLQATLTGTVSLNSWAFLYQQTPSTDGVSPMRVDWARVGQYAASGQYDSCVHDAGGVVNWSTLTALTSTPTGTGAVFRTRTSQDGGAWSAWSAPLTSTLITSPSGRYLQYRAELTTNNVMRSPEVRQVSLNYFGPVSLQIMPNPASVEPGGTQVFSAQAFDINNRPVSGLQHVWGVVSGGGTINSSGTFTAGLPAGVFTNTIVATVSTTGGPVAGFASVTVNDAVPLANPGGPYSMTESASVTLTASGSDPNGLPVVYGWDLDNNGVFETSGQAASFSRSDNGNFPVRLRVTENGGAALSTTVTATVTVTNVPPTATFNASASTLTEGSSFSLVLTDPFDVSEIDRLAGFTYAFDCGGGSGYGSFGASNIANCATSDDGVRTVRGRIRDKDGGISEYTGTVTVTNAAPLATIVGAPGSSAEGTAITLTSIITDAGVLDTHSYVWSVEKDSAPYASGTAAGLSFTPNDNGVYVVRLTATDDDGGAGTAAPVTITVSNVAPGAIFNRPLGSIPEGNSFNLSLTGGGDASSVDTAAGFTYAFDCGGGSGYGSFGASNIASCATSDDGVRTVRGRIRDKDGGISEYTGTVTVTNAAPLATIVGAPGSVGEGTGITLTSVVTDAGVLDTHSYVWSVEKDSAPYASGTTAGLSFTPNDNGVYVVRLTATDDDGGAGTAAPVTITVSNVAPGVVIHGAPPTGTVGAAITLTTTVTDPGSVDTFTYAWSVTKDGSAYTSGTAAGLSFTPDEAGTYEVTLVVTDKDGGQGSAQVTVIARYQLFLPLIMRFSP